MRGSKFSPAIAFDKNQVSVKVPLSNKALCGIIFGSTLWHVLMNS